MAHSAEDLAKMLGIKAPVAPVPAPQSIPTPTPVTLDDLISDEAEAEGDPIDIVTGEAEPGLTAPPSPTALKLDKWDIQRGTECLAASPALQAAFPGLNMTVLDEAREKIEGIVADCHGIAYLLDPQVAENCSDPRRAEYVKNLLQTPECQALRQSTVMNDLASEMAATSFGVEYAKLVQADAERQTKQSKKDPSKRNPEQEAMRDEMAMRRAVTAAINQAKDDVQDLKDAARGLGGDGGANSPQDARKIAELYKRIKKSRSLKEIFNRAGRFRLAMQSAQRRKSQHGVDDVVGVEMDGDVHRLLPVELAMLADEDLELDALRRLVERQSMCRLHIGSEKVARGPVVVCVDESGSMHGDPIWNAKAFALAMATLAKDQGRWCCLVGYSGGTEGTRLALPPGKWDQPKLLEWLEHFFNGGTDMDVPCSELPKWWGNGDMADLPKGKTDVILITDAIVNIPPAMEATFNAWKKTEQVKCLSLVIGKDAGDLKKISDEVHLVTGISTSETGVTAALSI